MTSTVHVRPFRHSGPGALILASVVSLVLACGGDVQDPTGPGDDGGNGSVTVQDVGLNVGESATFTADGEVLALRLPSASGGREYRLTVQSANPGSPGLTPMRLTRGDGSSGSGSVSASRGAAGVGADLPSRTRDLSRRQKIRENARNLLVRRGIRPARPSDSDTGSGPQIRLSSQVPFGRTPTQGELIQFWYTPDSDLNVYCDTARAQKVTAEVKVGRDGADRVVIVQDTTAPDPTIGGLGGFSSGDFQDIAATFDTLVVPVDSAYFGTPTDIDDNGRVYILFTPKVNELDEDNTRVGGLFVPNDLAESGNPEGEDGIAKPSGACEASNEAELLYLRSPDPDGIWGNATSVSEARNNAFSVSSHELQHLLNAGNRLIKQSGSFNDLETTWLSEALSHVAEEAVGLAAYGASVRANLTYAETAGSDAATFERYLRSDFYNASRFLLASDTARALATSDPGGLESLQMRGFGWLFVRWLADQYGSASGGNVPGTGEESFIRDLAQADGGLTTGVGNVEEVSGASFEELLADFGVMVAVDDDVDAADGARILPTWNLRDMYRELAANDPGLFGGYGQYPLDPVETGFTGGTTDFEIRPGPGKHFTISSSGSTPELELRLTDQAGNALSSSARARIVIFRAR